MFDADKSGYLGEGIFSADTFGSSSEVVQGICNRFTYSFLSFILILNQRVLLYIWKKMMVLIKRM